MYDYNHPKRLEDQGKWTEAAQAWRNVGRKEDADACQLIADSIEIGDRQREEDKSTVYTIFETLKGRFSYVTDKDNVKPGQRLIGRVYGITEAVEVISSLEENREDMERIITGMKLDFPELN